MKDAVIRRAIATPVRVPSRPDSLNSPGILDDDPGFAERFHSGRIWTEFPMQVKWIIELECDGLIGIGETYRDTPREAVETALRSIAGRDVLELDWRRLPVDNSRAYDAVESAVLDVAGKLLGVSVSQLLGGRTRDRVECSGWTGRRTPEDAAEKAFQAMQRGHRVFKFKCSHDDSIRAWTERIQERCGGGMRILLDPNQRWGDVETTLRLMDGVDPNVMCGLEDPIDRKNLEGFCHLREELAIPLFLHVALPYDQPPGDALRALALDAVDGFNFNGPMFRFVELAAAAAIGGKPCWHGSEVDLGILEASALHACAAAASCTIPSDIFGELVREDDLIVKPIVFEGGCALVPDGPGLGVELDREALGRYQSGDPVRC